MDTTFREIKDLAQGRAGHLQIGSGPITAAYLLPSICRLILSRAPGVKVEIDIGTNHFLREQLRRREIDLIAGLVRENDAEFSACPLIEDVVVVAAGRSHPIFQFDHPTMENLLQYAWILPISAVASRQWLNKRFELQGLEAPRAQIEVNSIPMLSDVISGTEMLCFVSRRTLARPDAAFLREVSLEMTTLRRSLGLSYLGSEMSPAVQKLIALVRKDRNWID